MRHGSMAVLAAALAVLASVAEAQPDGPTNPSSRRSAWPYVLLGAGPSTCGGSALDFHVGAGAESLAGHGLGFAIEIGGPAPADGTCLFGMLSVNGLYQLRRRTPIGEWLPFVTAGYTGLAAEGGGSGGNAGAGVLLFFKRHLGLRLEVRTHFVPYDDFTELRIGLVF